MTRHDLWVWLKRQVRNRSRFGWSRRKRLVIGACEHMLLGTVLDAVDLGQELMPPWVWINTLAHASRRNLEAIATMQAPRAVPAQLHGPHAMLVLLARELLGRADELQMPVVDLQRSVLVPIELRYFEAPMPPAALVRLVQAGLANWKSLPAQ